MLGFGLFLPHLSAALDTIVVYSIERSIYKKREQEKVTGKERLTMGLQKQFHRR